MCIRDSSHTDTHTTHIFIVLCIYFEVYFSVFDLCCFCCVTYRAKLITLSMIFLLIHLVCQFFPSCFDYYIGGTFKNSGFHNWFH